MRRSLVLVCVFLWATPAQAAITFFGVASTPADNSANLTEPTVVTPPSNMLVGDLVLVAMGSSSGSLTVSVSNAGGQTWDTTPGCIGAASGTSLCFVWACFDGTWDADPSFEPSGTGAATTHVMLVFRPSTNDTCTDKWTVDAGPTFANQAANTTFTITGVTRSGASSVAIGAWVSEAATASTWGSLSGTGWSDTDLGAQYRNTQGTTDSSMAFAYNIGTGATNNVAKTQSASNAGATGIIAFEEAETARGCIIGGGFLC